MESEKEIVNKFIGLEDLDLTNSMKLKIEELSADYSEEFVTIINNSAKLIVHFKQLRSDGQQQLHEIKSRLQYPGATITSKNEDWDLITALRDCFEDIKTQLKHRYKKRNQHKSSSTTEYKDAAEQIIR